MEPVRIVRNTLTREDAPPVGDLFQQLDEMNAAVRHTASQVLLTENSWYRETVTSRLQEYWDKSIDLPNSANLVSACKKCESIAGFLKSQKKRKLDVPEGPLKKVKVHLDGRKGIQVESYLLEAIATDCTKAYTEDLLALAHTFPKVLDALIEEYRSNEHLIIDDSNIEDLLKFAKQAGHTALYERCKQWIVKNGNPELKEQINLDNFQKFLWETDLGKTNRQTFRSQLRRFKDLPVESVKLNPHFRSSGGVSREFLEELILAFPNIKNLDLSHCFMKHSTFMYIASQLPQLRSLNLEQCTISNDTNWNADYLMGLLLKDFTALESLNLCGAKISWYADGISTNHAVSNKTLTNINSSKLQTLIVKLGLERYCGGEGLVSEKGLVPFLVKQNNLELLTIKGFSDDTFFVKTGEILEQINKCKSLIQLSISGNASEDYVRKYLVSLPDLELEVKSERSW